MLKTIPVSRRNEDYKKICKIMFEAFPEDERIPMWLLNLLAKRKFVNFDAIYDNNQLRGVLYIVENTKYLFVLYLAVNKKVRSQGYGSQIIDLVRKIAKDRNIVLHAEYPDDTSENAEQRERRMQFYYKNGILDTGYYFGEKKEKYAILSSDGVGIDIESYKSILRYLSLGFYIPKIKKT